MKVLVSAFTCRPGMGSEPGAGWTWAQAAAREHDVWLITHQAHLPEIERALEDDPTAAPMTLLTAELPLVVQRAIRPLGRAGWFVYYVLWQVFACRRTARRLHRTVGFDLTHHVTYASDWLPVGVAHLPGVPLVWGPVGGSSTIGGPRLWRMLGPRAVVVETARAVLLGLARLLVGRRTARAAAVVLAQNDDVRRAFAADRPRVEPHVAVEPGLSTLPPRPSRPSGRPPTAVFAGRLLGWKGLRLALGALRRPEAQQWHLDIYGTGRERRRLDHLARAWGVDDRVRFLGAQPRHDVLAAFRDADVVLFPSIHDAAGWTVAEALAVGCPVVALDLGGPATLMAAEDGVLVDPAGSDVEGALARALDEACTRRPGPSRWSSSRLPAVLRSIYPTPLGVTGSASRGLA